MNQTTSKTKVVGVDISLDQTTCAVVDVRGNIIAHDGFCTTDYENLNDFVSVLCERLIKLIMDNGGYDEVRSVGVSSKSANFMTGSIENASNLPWKGVIPLAAMLRDRLGLAVGVANNAYVITLGEHAFGSAHGMRDFIVVTLGSGMGSCLFSNGNVYRGYGGFAGEVGHTCVKYGGRQCGCGKKGCLETYTAAKGIVQTARELMAESDASSLLRQLEHLSPRTIAECCDQGDEMAIEVYRRTGHYLGLGLANYASVIDPEAIIFTGGIVKAGKWLLEPARESFEKHVFHNVKGKVKFLTSTLKGREGDVLGASVLAWNVKEYSLFK